MCAIELLFNVLSGKVHCDKGFSLYLLRVERTSGHAASQQAPDQIIWHEACSSGSFELILYRQKPLQQSVSTTKVRACTVQVVSFSSPHLRLDGTIMQCTY